MVPNTNVMDDYVGYPLLFQYMFDRRTTPWEKTLWNDEELENFNIDLEFIDRLYYINYVETVEEIQYFEMIARMNYKEKKVYVELLAACTVDFGFDCQGEGTIFISEDASIFMQLVLKKRNKKNLIYQSLREDGIQVKEQIAHDLCTDFQGTKVLSLKLLCHLAVYKNKKKLGPNILQLPKILLDSVNDYIRIRDAKYAYEWNGFFYYSIP